MELGAVTERPLTPSQLPGERWWRYSCRHQNKGECQELQGVFRQVLTHLRHNKGKSLQFMQRR